MRLDFESNTASLPFAENGLSEDSAQVSSQTKELLREGVKAAQAGNRLTARTLLLRVTEIEPSNENAWLWLASISEYPEELVVFLKNVLEINPHNERALEWMAATKTLLAKTFVQRGVDAAKENRLDFAKQCFEQALAQDSQNEMAWLWLASIADTEAEKRSRLEHLLTINPANEAALNALKSLQTQASQQLLQTANRCAAEGDKSQSAEMLAEVLEKSPDLADAWLLKAHLTDSFDEKIKCFKHVLDLNPEHQAAKTALNSLQTLMEFTAPSMNFEKAEAPATEMKIEAAPEAVQDEENFTEGDSAEETPAMELSGDEPSAELETPVEDSPVAETADFYAADSSEEVQDQQPAEFSDEMRQQPETAEFAHETNFYDEPEELETAAVEEESADEIWAGDITEEANRANYESDFSQMSADEFRAAAQNDENEMVADEEQFTHENQTTESNFAESQPETFEAAETVADDFYQTAESLTPAEDFQPEEMAEVQHSENAEAVAFQPSETQEAGEFDASGESAEAEQFAETAESFEQNDSETTAEVPVFAAEPAVEMSECPFCETANEALAFACRECRATISLSDLEMLLGNENADKLRLQQVVSRMEMDKTARELTADELKNLAVAHFNLKNLRQGFGLLQEVSQAHPNDVVLASQVNALAIRLAEIEEKEAEENGKTKGKTILVIDDSATVRKLISGKLEKSGHEVVCAVDGMDALAKLNEIVPDLILLDITMPRMDGYQVCKLIRNSETTKNIPVVMISGKDGFFDKVRGRMAGTTGYITKPFGPETLMKALEIYMDKGAGDSH